MLRSREFEELPWRTQGVPSAALSDVLRCHEWSYLRTLSADCHRVPVRGWGLGAEVKARSGGVWGAHVRVRWGVWRTRQNAKEALAAATRRRGRPGHLAAGLGLGWWVGLAG